MFGGGGGGLMGGTTTGTGGLFGSSQPAATQGGLFGGGNTGGLSFAGSTTGGGGLFGGTTTASTGLGGGLFNQPTQQPTSGGLGIFGGQPAASGISFGIGANAMSQPAMFGSMVNNPMGNSMLSQPSGVQINGTQLEEFVPELHKDNLYVMSYNNIPKHLGAPLKLLRLKDYMDIKAGQVNQKIAPYMKNYIDVCNGRAQPNVYPGGLYGPQQSSNTMGGMSSLSGGLGSTSGGLFGGNAGSSAATGGGLFGGGNLNKPAATGGLFGTTMAGTSGQMPGGGLFGGGATATSGAGLFGGSTAAPASGGLFGGGASAPAQTGGLFGGQGQTSAPSGGLFGGGQTANAPASGGLFGGAQPASGGLFGGGQPAPQATGGLFGGAQPTSGGLFGGQATAAPAGGLFGGAAGAPASGGLFGGQGQNVAQAQPSVGGYPVVRGGITLPESSAPYALYYVPLAEKEKGQGYKLPDFVTNDPNFPNHQDTRPSVQDEAAATAASQRAELLAGMRTYNTNSRYKSSGHNPLDNIELNNARMQMRPPRPQACPLNTALPLRPHNNLAAISQLSHGSHWQTLTIPPVVNKIQVAVEIEGVGEVVKEVEPQTLVANLIRKLVDEDLTPSNENREKYLSEWSLQLNGVTLDHMKTIKECNVNNQALLLTRKRGTSSHQAAVSYVPVLTRKGYQTEPAYSQLCRMSEAELKTLHNFTIQNQYGRVQFFDETDVRGLDLDRLVSIEPGQVEIYPEGTVKPQRGHGLNKPALVTFFQYGLRTKKNLPEFIKRFKARAGEMGAIYISHDVDQDSITIQIDASD